MIFKPQDAKVFLEQFGSQHVHSLTLTHSQTHVHTCSHTHTPGITNHRFPLHQPYFPIRSGAGKRQHGRGAKIVTFSYPLGKKMREEGNVQTAKEDFA